jgi:hypothetical protein
LLPTQSNHRSHVFHLKLKEWPPLAWSLVIICHIHNCYTNGSFILHGTCCRNLSWLYCVSKWLYKPKNCRCKQVGLVEDYNDPSKVSHPLLNLTTNSHINNCFVWNHGKYYLWGFNFETWG